MPYFHCSHAARATFIQVGLPVAATERRPGTGELGGIAAPGPGDWTAAGWYADVRSRPTDRPGAPGRRFQTQHPHTHNPALTRSIPLVYIQGRTPNIQGRTPNIQPQAARASWGAYDEGGRRPGWAWHESAARCKSQHLSFRAPLHRARGPPGRTFEFKCSKRPRDELEQEEPRIRSFRATGFCVAACSKHRLAAGLNGRFAGRAPDSRMDATFGD